MSCFIIINIITIIAILVTTILFLLPVSNIQT